MAVRVGYCTNVHAGANWEQTRSQLETHALEVKRRYSPSQPMGIGLWLSAGSAAHLVQSGGVAAFAAWLENAGLVPFTLNGFPYGDFHQPVVKHRVYEPTWWEPARGDYTIQLANILHQLLPAGEEGSISTLPIAWGLPRPSAELLTAAGDHLARVALHLAELEQRTGRLIYVCLEPEPGCVFDTTVGAIAFFHDHLWRDRPAVEVARLRRYIRLCHDICHAAVMFEPQHDVFQKCAAAEILVGKVQVSAAVQATFTNDPAANRAAWQQLQEFNEPRYLHQTVVRDETSGATAFYQDLPAALAATGGVVPTQSQWRVHFHVPIYLPSFGALASTQAQISAALASARNESQVGHWEVETYAWSVLPPELKQPSLAAGIAAEMEWFAALLAG